MDDRQIWLSAMRKIAHPVLSALAEGKLKEKFPADFHPDRNAFAPLEAFGRTLCGIAPWLEADGLTGEELTAQNEFITLAQAAMDHATDPSSPDFLNFSQNSQPLVDAAFLAHAMLRAPQVLCFSLEERVKQNLADALKSTRVLKPGMNNWLFFSAMIEAALCMMGEDYEQERIDLAIDTFHEKYYVGDGTYGDGPFFHWDYYNSYVIHPMLIDILRLMKDQEEKYAALLPVCVKRASRYSAVLEQMIAHDGTYTVVGRSSVYRFGAFQLLSQAALQDFLPPQLTPGQVRAGLTAVIAKCMEHPDMLHKDGWLLPGVYGCQPSLAEPYISTGSLYLCAAVFVALGLSPSHPFWSDPPKAWTAKKIWSGQDVMRDHCID